VVLASVDSKGAYSIGVKFFEQYHSDVIVKEVTFDNDTWIVKVSIGMITKQDKQVRIDAKTGKILGYR
jgi:uncharacterized membrane protein YkoI